MESKNVIACIKLSKGMHTLTLIQCSLSFNTVDAISKHGELSPKQFYSLSFIDECSHRSKIK